MTAASFDRPAAAAVVRATATETIVHARGEFDIATLPILETALSRAQAHGRDVLVDVAEVSFLDAGSLAAIVRAHRDLDAEARMLRLVNVPPRITRLLALLELRGQLAG